MSSLTKSILVKSCMICDPSLFIKSLMRPNVKVSFINKVRFYKYFKFIIEDAKQNKSDEELTLKIEDPYEINFQGGKNYCFYDSNKRAPLIIVEAKESNGILYVDIHPF